jgi:hypothetical protein
MRKAIAFCGCLVVVMALPAFAGVEFFDVPSNEWDAALANAGKVSKGTTDFSTDGGNAYPISGFAGPLTSAGGGPVSPGVVLDNMAMFGLNYVGLGTDVVTLGPQYGFGNVDNVVLANYFVDSFQIDIDDPLKTAMSMTVYNTTNGGSDVSVFDANGALLGVAAGVPANGNIGILTNGGDSIGGINIFDPGNGAEGITRVTAYNVPEPASLALLALGAVAAIRRRR